MADSQVHIIRSTPSHHRQLLSPPSILMGFRKTCSPQRFDIISSIYTAAHKRLGGVGEMSRPTLHLPPPLSLQMHQITLRLILTKVATVSDDTFYDRSHVVRHAPSVPAKMRLTVENIRLGLAVKAMANVVKNDCSPMQGLLERK